MHNPWGVKDLEYWDAKIRDKVDEFGLSYFPQEFEVCDHEQMLGYMAYSGMPAHYPHWSYGKSYEKLKTLYDYGVSGLPYEMVINADPSLAYLMRGNSLCLQILTIAQPSFMILVSICGIKYCASSCAIVNRSFCHSARYGL